MQSFDLRQVKFEHKRDAERVLWHFEVLAKYDSRSQIREHEIVLDANLINGAPLNSYCLFEERSGRGFKYLIHDLQGIACQFKVYLVHVFVVVEDLPEEGKELFVDQRPRTSTQHFHNQIFKQTLCIFHALFLFSDEDHNLLQLLNRLRLKALGKPHKLQV